ncbi:DUF6626 family protein [Aurantimonas sp. VKM B-3413]|uniref:DUF6626 family protein n=1 Tax=Aurantimonas sp. VKM B-3413 TaxID=2779401 RepID=UPI001E5B44A9|nr:DUF6626 family protein [Aurantimonas sp. VKM B-3413]MCB8837022.1 hypothetical protein [Aurantimonas sp. VKM B-3413]
MNIEEIFNQLVEAKMVVSQTEFSRIWLGRSGRYFSHLLATKQEPGLGTLIALELRLQRFATTFTKRADKELLVQLAHQLRGYIELRSITAIRRPHTRSTAHASLGNP